VSETLFDEDDDANTPLTPQERDGLIPTYITLRSELNVAEQENITEADLLAVQLGRPRFSWGGGDLAEPAQTRRAYVQALQRADGHDIEPLLAFART